MGAGKKRGPPSRRGGGARSGRFSGHKGGAPRGAVAMATQSPALARQLGLREASLRMEVFAAGAAVATIFLLLVFLIFVSVYVGSRPVHQTLSQNC